MHESPQYESVELPSPTAAPLVFGVGISMLGAGLAIHPGFFVVGVLIFGYGLGGWISQLLPGQGHEHEPFAASRPTLPTPAPNTVESLKPGGVGYRFRLPEHVHPLSSGIKGGLVGALLMPIPALAYGLIEHGSIWFPINLLVGLVLPDYALSESGMTPAQVETSLRQFYPVSLALGTVVHLAFSVTFGLMYGVILPMLPTFRGSAIVYGGVITPILWSGVCYGLMGIVNPLMKEHINWYWFLLSQFVYGISMSYVVHRSEFVAVSQAPPLQMGKKKPTANPGVDQGARTTP